MTGLPTLTLWQPWASLVAAGVKKVETRSWSTKHRGRIGIHAGAHVDHRAAGDLDEQLHAIGICFTDWQGTARHHAQGLATGVRGALVATAELIDVVPIIGSREERPPASFVAEYEDESDGGELPHHRGGLWLIGVNELTHGTPTHIEAQRPYGDFTPGRYAWLHDDIKPTTERCPACWGKSHELTTRSHSCLHPGCTDIYNIDGTHDGPRCPVCDGAGCCPPIPTKGRQGLWGWEP